MRFTTKDPDIETIVRRIEEGDYDLQPDFQRGEVWTLQKKTRLIDSILRGWHIPPIHLVSRDGGVSDVLDGQQRLTAIRDFVRGDFAVDGNIEPANATLKPLHGLRFLQLPPEYKKIVRNFTIRIFELSDFLPDEPHELFFRLNQPTSLTEAEKRNAFIGAPRNQIKDMVKWASTAGMTQQVVGFSNARMAYDDVLARALVTLESGSLDVKVTASRITERYRSNEPFSQQSIDRLKKAIHFVLNMPDLLVDDSPIRLNKATLHTWLLFTAQLEKLGLLERLASAVERVISDIETARWTSGRSSDPSIAGLMSVFQDRSTARVADVSSVLIRDVITWMVFSRLLSGELRKVPKAAAANALWPSEEYFSVDLDETLYRAALAAEWGALSWE